MASIYGAAEASSLGLYEDLQRARRQIEHAALLAMLPPAGTVLDVGCGAGQFLEAARQAGMHAVGLDESVHRLRHARERTAVAGLLMGTAQDLPFRSAACDGVVACQVLHEVELSLGAPAFDAVLAELARILKPSGVLIVADHFDAGDGDVAIRIEQPVAMVLLTRFAQRFMCRAVTYERQADGSFLISRRLLQEFCSKWWFLGTAMEDIEMRETHNVFTRVRVEESFRRAGLSVSEWRETSNVADDLALIGVRLVSGEAWCRRFICVGVKG